VRAWTIAKGTKAFRPRANSPDFKGFHQGEVFHYNDLIRLGTEQAVKAAGCSDRGQEYVVADGDIMLFQI
jgi:ribosome-binding ATPase YchF (GTP1/OBG family)